MVKLRKRVRRKVWPRGPLMTRIELDDEEISALIDYHLTHANDAVESGEYQEAKERRARAAYLLTFAG
jgi:hypothetical protein